MIDRKIIIIILFLFFLLSSVGFSRSLAEGINITIYSDKETGQINKKLFGSNFKGRDPYFSPLIVQISDYGSGVWNPIRNKPEKEVMDLARSAGVSIVRYANSLYKLENIIGRRLHPQYGLDEFLKTTESIGAAPVIIIPVHPDVVRGQDKDFSKRAKHAADIVEYLNSPLGENPDNDDDPHENIAWAEIRAKNGHPDPYNVRYFEIGNEPYARPNVKGKPQKGGSGVDFNWGYGNLFNKLSTAMKAIDPSVQTGLSLIAIPSDARNRNILKTVEPDKLDYVILHTYLNPAFDKDKGADNGDEFLMNASRQVLSFDVTLKKFRVLIKETTGKANVPFGISEYNCSHSYSCHTKLLSALLNAELLNIFMKPENNVLMANHWQMSDGLYGMIQSRRSLLRTTYVKRPNYYIYEMYNKHFGDILIHTEITGDTYDNREYSGYIAEQTQAETAARDTNIPYLLVNASKNRNNKKMYLMVINRNMNKEIKASVTLKDILPGEKADAWILNGPSVDASNEKKVDNVNLNHKEFEIKGNVFGYTFEQHSLTAIEISVGH